MKQKSYQQISKENKKTERQINSQYHHSLEKLARLLGKNKEVIRQALEDMGKQSNSSSP